MEAANRGAALDNAMRLGLLLFGVGAGARGLQGLYNLTRRQFQPSPATRIGTHILDIPTREEEEVGPVKLGQDGKTIWETGVQPFADAIMGRVSGPGNWAFAMPAALLAGGAGLVGSYKLTDLLMDARRKQQINEELAASKSRYEEALSGKSALAQDLDKLYDQYQTKKGTMADMAGNVIGGGLTLAIPAALASGLLTYDLFKKRSPAEVLRKAQKKRLRELAQRQPPAVYARPSYPSSTAGSEVPTEDELAGEPLDIE